jgi:hypothetical protein
MLHCFFAPFLAGSVAAGVAVNPKRRRPLVRGIVKGGIAAKRRLETVSAGLVLQTRHLIDEARAELDRPGTERRD